MKKLYKTIINVFIVVSLFFVLFVKVDIKNIFDVFTKINIVWIIHLLFVFVLTKFISTLNLYIIIRAMDRRVKYFNLFRYFLLATALGKFFPGKTGEISLTLLLRKHENFEYGEGLAVHLIDKLVTLMIIGAISIYGVIFFFRFSGYYAILIVSFFALLLVLFILFWSDKVRGLIKKYILRKYSKYFRGFSLTFKYIIRHKKAYLLLNFVITFILLLITFVGSIFIFKAFNADVSIIYIAIISSIVLMMQFFPLPFSGLGVKEISGTYLYFMVGVPLAIAANYMLFDIVFKYLSFFTIYLIYNRKLLRT